MKITSLTLATLSFVVSKTNAAGGSGWDYDHQEDWMNVDTPNNECGRVGASGVGQSPIDIPSSSCGTESDSYEFYNGDCTIDDLSFAVGGAAVTASYPDPSVCKAPSFKIPGVENVYDVLQFHIHTKSEHRVAGESADAELHIVHKERTYSEDYQLAVVGIFLEGGDSVLHHFDDVIAGFWASSCVQKHCQTNLSDNHNDVPQDRNLAMAGWSPYMWVAKGTHFFKYYGGLTTPPCTEIVNWNVAKSPMTISFRQLMELSTMIIGFDGNNEDDKCKPGTSISSVIGSTSRDAQELLGRVPELVCTESIMATTEPTSPSVAASPVAAPADSGVGSFFSIGVAATGVIVPALAML